MSQLGEENVIGALMINPDCIEQICNDLKPEMFTDPILSAVYAEFLQGYERGYEVNIVTLDERVDMSIPREILNQTILDCAKDTPTSASVKSYAQAVIDDYKVEQTQKIMSRVQLSAANINGDVQSLIGELEEIQGEKKSEGKPLAQITKENEGNYFNEKNAKKINIGFPKLDEMLGGLEGGDMIAIGARPAVGKSALAAQIASYVANHGGKVGYFSLEMQEKQMYERFLASESGISLKRIRRGICFKNDEEEKFNSANEKLQNQTNIVITTGGKSMSEIRAESRHAGYDLIIIDYLQLLKPDSHYRGNRYAEVGAISHSIKNLAMELNIPIIALSQMNRVSESRETKEPTMAELRESGDVEQDASVIILLWNEDELDPSIKGCKIEKQRQGETGKLELEFDGTTMHFEEIDNPFM